jgi:hypothetical protein
MQFDEDKPHQCRTQRENTMEELEQLRKENKGLKAVCSIMKTSLASDCRYNTELLERLLAMQQTSRGGIHESLNWSRDSRFKVLDSAGEHDPVYVVTPNGETLPFNHYNDQTTDLARAHFVAEALNDAWDKIRKGGSDGQNT